MGQLLDELSKSLQTGFIDQTIQSNNSYHPQFLVNNKNVGKKILTTIELELRKCDEFWFSVAFVTTSGIATLINTLIELEKKGIKGKVLVSQYLNFTEPEALKRLLQFKNIELRIAIGSNFHSKGYLFKTKEVYDLIIGSSNLTANALCSNVEWNLKITATPVSAIINSAINEFTNEFNKATSVDYGFIANYEKIYNSQYQLNKAVKKDLVSELNIEMKPNSMQIQALANIEHLRSIGKNKALLISATGTGKTYLSAFDAKKFNPKKFLFIVHRLNIAKAAMKTFKTVISNSKTMGLYSGETKELDKDYIFSTVQTISKDENLRKFNPDHFEYIVIDESHRAGADSYTKIIEYFKPKFLMGMTATPERTDGLDIFKLFDHNIAYEIRLHRAMEENMLSPFHYYGVTDISVNGIELEENSDFSYLVSIDRINHIIEKSKLYGCDNGNVRGLIFCSKIEECRALSASFNELGFKTISLTGESSETERSHAISLLESNNPLDKIDYIFTVDIFNEGIDIPSVNQIIMLRPTQSAIVFVQQLGRGLRKIENKEYLTVIDFIGNYSNSYLVPIALYGDTSYNKDSLRKFMASGSRLIPGASTVNFDHISRERIFAAIDAANMQLKKDLVNEYKLLKFKLGRIPMMVDFLEHGSRDPQLFVSYSRSYFNFVKDQEDNLKSSLKPDELKLIELFSSEINNSKRIEESLILLKIIENGRLEFHEFEQIIKAQYGYELNESTIKSCERNLNFEFVTENYEKKLLSVREIHNIDIVKIVGDSYVISPAFKNLLKNTIFKNFLIDNINYSIQTFDRLFDKSNFYNGFSLYRKYSRKDVFRILNWDKNPLAQNVGGYIISSDKSNCPIFVNYHKEESISSTTKYEDGFLNNKEFEWMSKSRRTLDSPDVQSIFNYKKGLRLPLFIKKNNDEGTEFYYMGDVVPIDGSFKQSTMSDDSGNNVSVVKITFEMKNPVDDGIYNYITNSITNQKGVGYTISKVPLLKAADNIKQYKTSKN